MEASTRKLEPTTQAENERDQMDTLSTQELSEIPYEILYHKMGEIVPPQDILFKLIIIGNSGVGKSCLMQRITTNEFKDDHEVTIGVEFGSLIMKIQEVIFKLQIWDTAGQE